MNFTQKQSNFTSKILIQTHFNLVLELSQSFSYIDNNNKSMFNQSNIAMNNLFKMPSYLFILLLNLKWINRNIICNEQLLLDSSFQLQKFQIYQTENSTTRSIQQIISSPDSSFTCNVSSYFLVEQNSFQTLISP